MNYLSVCSGIEAATVAWHHMGWEPAGFSEIEKFPSQVLDHHYPNVPKLGDMTKYKEWDIGAIDLLVGGTPCQSFSVAGLRKGLEDSRGNLALVYCGILDHFKPRWFVWENVPGVLSSNGGRDFGSFLGAVAQLGYGFAYRVLDAQFFGVAQRRRRVFVVGHLGSWQRAAAVLFERQSLRRDTAPSREARKDITECAGTLTANGGGLNRPAGNANELDFCVTTYAIQGSMIGRNYNAGPQGDGINEEVCFTQNTIDRHAVAQPLFTAGVDYENNGHTPDEPTRPLLKGSPTGGGRPLPAISLPNMAVRRLTPIECERLQGFPDNYTNIKDNCPDGPRYKALGNSMAVPVMRWIGEKINMMEIKYD